MYCMYMYGYGYVENKGEKKKEKKEKKQGKGRKGRKGRKEGREGRNLGMNRGRARGEERRGEERRGKQNYYYFIRVPGLPTCRRFMWTRIDDGVPKAKAMI